MFNKKDNNSVNIENVGINNIDNKEPNDKDKKRNPYYLFLSFIIKRMKSDKLYFCSFIITILFLIVFSIYNISEAEGLYNTSNDTEKSTEQVKSVVDSNNDELNIKDYIGIYSKEVILDETLVIDDACSIDAYKIAYQIKKDKSIRKFFINDCIGTVEIWKDELAYASNGGARYITANDIHYLFAASSMKEVDGDTFTIDDDLSTLKNKIKLSNIEVYFEDKNTIIMTYNNLYLINASNGTSVLGEYLNNGGALEKRVYKSDIKRQFNFIVFSNGEEMNCYNEIDENFVDGNLYKIYTIKYNSNLDSFNKPKEIISRNKSISCSVFDEDFITLKE